MMIRLNTPIVMPDVIKTLDIGMKFEIHGKVLCGRDAVLPKLVRAIMNKDPLMDEIDLNGAVIFHTAVSSAGIGPTTSNKAEIEESIPELARAGVKIHLGKGSLSLPTIQALKEANSVFAVTPPVTALFSHRITSKRVIAFPEEGMEALYEIEVKGLPGIIAAAQGRNIFDK
ncbi:fumarate hydratase C-terminal domain-containing protein [Desulfocicer niacini]